MARDAWPARRRRARPSATGRVAQGAVLEQPATELVLVGLVAALGHRRKRLGRQHAPRLQEDQLRRDGHELGQVRRVDRVAREVLDVRVGDLGQGTVRMSSWRDSMRWSSSWSGPSNTGSASVKLAVADR